MFNSLVKRSSSSHLKSAKFLTKKILIEEGNPEERRMNPDLNCSDFNLHKIRLGEFKRPEYLSKIVYMGSKGGIYTFSASETRNYK